MNNDGSTEEMDEQDNENILQSKLPPGMQKLPTREELTKVIRKVHKYRVHLLRTMLSTIEYKISHL